MIQKVMLQVKDHLLFKARKVILLEHSCAHGKKLDSHHDQQNRQQQIQAFCQHDIIHQVAKQHWLRKCQQADKKNQPCPGDSLPPVTGKIRTQVLQI